MLIERGDERGLEKLQLSQQLARKSLDDIRTAVHLMKQSGPEFHLVSSMKTLIEETMQAAGIDVDFDIGPLPPLTSMQKKVLYYALKEGLTNGIRHGSCSRFQFRLERREDGLRFSLRNNGIPVEPDTFGFGLNTMRERVTGLGGTIRLAAASDGGSELLIKLPVP